MCRFKNIEQSFIVVSPITGWVSISPYALLVGIPICMARSAAKLKICGITVVIKKYKSKLSTIEEL